MISNDKYKTFQKFTPKEVSSMIQSAASVKYNLRNLIIAQDIFLSNARSSLNFNFKKNTRSNSFTHRQNNNNKLLSILTTSKPNENTNKISGYYESNYAQNHVNLPPMNCMF